MILANNVFKFDKEQYEKWIMEQKKQRIQKLYYDMGRSFNYVMWNLGYNYEYTNNLFKKFGFERRPNDYDPRGIG